MTLMEPIPISTNDLLRHSEVRLQVHGNEVAWVRSIAGTPDSAVVAVGLGTVTMFGRLDVVRERLAAVLEVVDAAIAQPDRWPEVGLRRIDERSWARDGPNPFVSLGNGPAGPELTRPIAGLDEPDESAQPP